MSRLNFAADAELFTAAFLTPSFLMKLITIRGVKRLSVLWGFMMVDRGYLSRQAASLLNFARATGNPELAAALVERASNLKSQVDELANSSDISPKAPDVEASPRSFRRP
jgi:hypothetical protein